VFPCSFQGREQGIIGETRLEAGTAIDDKLLPLALADRQRAIDVIDMTQGLQIFAGRDFSPGEIVLHNGDGPDGVGGMVAGICMAASLSTLREYSVNEVDIMPEQGNRTTTFKQ
jgi:hypothetical protein